MIGVPRPERVEGLNLSDIWEGTKTEVRSQLYTAYEDKQRAVRDGRWKLIRYPRLHFNQLFDLANDPDELRNLAEDPDYAAELERLTALLEAWHETSGDRHPLLADEKDSMDFDYESVRRSPDEHQPAWVVEKYFGE